jgi:8-oxo-dGTP pyrophosphatase MutT (NUDIX family)
MKRRRPIVPVALAVFRRGDRILVYDLKDLVLGRPFFRPPGGRIEWRERSADALRREIREELGAEVDGVRLLGILENLFTFCGARASRDRLFLKKILEVDPLICSQCQGVMKIISFIEGPPVIHRILAHLNLWDVPKRSPPVSPPRDFSYHPDFFKGLVN